MPYHGPDMLAFLKKEFLPLAALGLALASMAFVPPDAGYLSYVDWGTIGLLACLMAVVAGFTRAGLFDVLSVALLDHSTRIRRITLLLVCACFFGSMLVTNDVVLLAFVPLTIALFQLSDPRRLVTVVVLETLAANLGSMVTPIGNPQNLYLYSHYRMDLPAFLAATLPYGAASLAGLLLAVAFTKDGFLDVEFRQKPRIRDRRALVLHVFLFVACVLAVLRVIPMPVCLALVGVAVLALDRGVFRTLDYGLLVTFGAFFVFVGNLARVDAVRTAVSSLVGGRELLAGVLVSQAISNVPAAILLSGFTDQARRLLLGVDLGGLGTLVASLASLISFRIYLKSEGARPVRFLLVFTAWNAAFLAGLLLLAALLRE